MSEYLGRCRADWDGTTRIEVRWRYNNRNYAFRVGPTTYPMLKAVSKRRYTEVKATAIETPAPVVSSIKNVINVVVSTSLTWTRVTWMDGGVAYGIVVPTTQYNLMTGSGTSTVTLLEVDQFVVPEEGRTIIQEVVGWTGAAGWLRVP